MSAYEGQQASGAETTAACPTPHKRPFSSKRVAKRSGVGKQKFGRVYLCPCGAHWHVTTQTRRAA